MEIQFTIKLSGSSGGTNAAVQANQPGDKTLQAKSLDTEKKKQSAIGAAKGGQGGDQIGPGGGGGLGAGQVIVIGPIVISGAQSSAQSSDDGTGGQGGDQIGPGGAPANKE
jgi:hypothetical protein